MTQILECRLPEARIALDKMARKYHFTWKVDGPAFLRPRSNVRVVDIKVDGFVNSKVGDYTFVARIELGRPENIVDTIPGERVDPKYRTTDATCEHCNRKRDRRWLYVVRGPDGETRQVGRRCLREYIGLDTPEIILRRFACERALGGLFMEMDNLGPAFDDVETVMAATSAAIRLDGWQPGSGDDPTWTHIDEYLGRIEPGDREAARAAILWIIHDDVHEQDDFWAKLRTIAVQGAARKTRRALVAAGFASYIRAQEERRQPARDSEFIGEPKQRLRGIRVRVVSGKSVPSDWGRTVLYRMKDPDGNAITWFSSGSTILDVGSEYTADMTVAQHRDGTRGKETQVTRLTIKETAK